MNRMNNVARNIRIAIATNKTIRTAIRNVPDPIFRNRFLKAGKGNVLTINQERIIIKQPKTIAKKEL